MVGQGYGVITFTTKKTDSVQQPQQMQQPQVIQQPQLVIQQPQQLMNEQYVQNQPQQQQPFMLESPQSFQQNIQPPMYQSIPVQQPTFFEQQQQSHSQQNNNNNQQSSYGNQMYPSFSLNDELDDESQSLLHNDEEIARSLDIELNGNINRNNNNRNNLVGNDPNRLTNHLNPNNRLMNLSDLNNFINNRHSQNRNNNLNSLVRQDFHSINNNNYYVQQPPREVSIDDIIFVGLNTFVTALSKSTGQEVWRSYVPTSYGLPISMIFTQGKINVASCGHVYCLNAYTGKELWRNKLPGLRYTNVSIVSSSNHNSFYNANSTLLYHAHH